MNPLYDLPGEVYTIEGNDKILDNCKYPLVTIQVAQYQKQANTRGLAKLLKLKFGTKLMLTVSIDMKDRLINDKTGIFRHLLKVVFVKYMLSFLFSG